MPAEILERLSRRPFSVVGHRGARGLAPENSLRALREAIRAGADVAEFDVQVTADGIPVASHDPVIVADDGSRVDIRSTRWPDLSRITVGGEPLARIEEILAEARGRIGIFLEVKEPRDTAAVCSLLHRLDAVNYTAMISFYEEALLEARRLIPGLVTGIIYFKPPGKILDCKRMGCRIVLPRYPLATAKAVTLAHRLGLKVVAWTVNDAEWVRRLVERGVDAIATDYPDRLVRLREELSAGSR